MQIRSGVRYLIGDSSGSATLIVTVNADSPSGGGSSSSGGASSSSASTRDRTYDAKKGWVSGMVFDPDLGGQFCIDINAGMKTGWQLIDGSLDYIHKR